MNLTATFVRTTTGSTLRVQRFAEKGSRADIGAEIYMATEEWGLLGQPEEILVTMSNPKEPKPEQGAG